MTEFENARQSLLIALREYLIGPLEGATELIDEPPRDRYHVGTLAPSGTAIPPEEDDQDDTGESGGAEATSSDGILALANISRQAAVGMTFQAPRSAELLIDLQFGEYTPEIVEEDKGDSRPAPEGGSEIKPTEEGPGPEDTTHPKPPDLGAKYAWRRIPKEFKALPLPVCSKEHEGKPVMLKECDGIQVVVIQRLIGDVRAITVSVVNRRAPERRDNKKEKGSDVPLADRAIYQVALRAYHPEGQSVFVARPPGIHISDDEFLAHEVLYRNVRQFAVGHGCAVDWKQLEVLSAEASEIRLEWIPAVEVHKASADVAELAGAKMLDLEFLADQKKEGEICSELRILAASYQKWISNLKAIRADVIASFDDRLKQRVTKVIDDNIGACAHVNERIVEGIERLASDGTVFESFCLANEAMAVSMRLTRRDQRPRWYPFQLAFLLMSIPSSVDPNHPDRDVMDLIWFPTGGGKTEAYLGLVAFVLFHRRRSVKDPNTGSGTAILTRYTLRLLTVQQFERAARTVMACEVIRRRDSMRFGEKVFSIGLFIGNTATPGDLEKARKIIRGNAEPDETATTLPLTKCPWCEHALHYRDQTVNDKVVLTKCPNNACDFHTSIPFGCVDEHLYNAPPSMIIGTVDKFAMMAWEPRIREFFGLGMVKMDPPSLIIQDELHLIGDALGTVTALYETVVDHLCSTNGRGPKIVGSTATIRRAQQQIRSIYARRVQQFPPSGIDHNDSFFYCEDRSIAGRLYVGVHAQGRSPKFTLSRVIGILAQKALSIPDPKVRDHYYTLVAYFNSLRELGGAIVLAYDDVRRYIDSMPNAGAERRKLSVVQELTSYLPSQEIPAVLEKIARGLLDEDEDSEPIDLLLSTNMISVGVDVDRLGAMIVNGQPKTTSEYIQASSRVGRPRGSAGLVVALYNWTRPRDRSHYERFRSYHQSFYRYVEATSVTPFSARARDRALHGVLFSLARLTLPELTGTPGHMLSDELLEKLNALCKLIADRAYHVDKTEAVHTAEALSRLLHEWSQAAQQNVSWKREQSGGTPYFLCPPSRANNDGVFEETPMSMRDVDPPSPVQLLSSSELAQLFAGDQP